MRERVRQIHRQRFDRPPADPTLIADAERLGDRSLVFEALVAEATWLLFAEQLAEAEATSRRALALYRADPGLARPDAEPNVSHLFNRLHVVTDWSGRLLEAYRFGAESLAHAGADAGQGVLLADVFHSEVSFGVVGRATELYAATGWRPAFQAPGGRWAEISIARLVATEGNARDPIARMVALAEQTDAPDVPAMLRWHFASWGAAYAVEQGHWDLVERAIGRLDAMMTDGDPHPSRRQRAEYAVLQAEVAHARGDTATARRRLDELAAVDDPYNANVFARAALLRATHALVAGRAAAAMVALDDAAGRFDVLPKQLRPRYNRLRRAAWEGLGDYAALTRDLNAELDEFDRPRQRQAVVDLLGEDLTTRLDAVFEGLQASLVGHLRWEQGEVVEAISHDLAGAATLVRLSLGLVGSEPERVSAVLDAAAQRMRSIVDSFAVLVSLERSRLRPTLSEHALVALVERAVANVRPLADSKDMTIRFEPICGPGVVRADAGLFEMSLSNVLENAVKYAPRSTDIEVALERDDEAMLAVRVSDAGPGLAADELDTVFQRHVRGRARPTGGETSLGLGLYIARALCELMGGRLWATSAGLGHGATFTLALPELVAEDAA